MTSFLSDVRVYVGRVREFDGGDWLVYLGWIGLMLGLVGSTGGFLLLGSAHGVAFPDEAWLVPIGAALFAVAIAIDTIGHRTIYKEALRGGEELVHHVTIASGIGSCMFLCAAYPHRAAFALPAAVLTAVSLLYSLIDEVFHWRRYVVHESDRVEMWSHALIFLGHGIMMAGWWAFYARGYPGVAETLAVLGGGS